MKKTTLTALFLFFIQSLLSQPGWSWQNPLPQGNPLFDISFISACGWAVGPMGTAIHSCDYGETWMQVDLGTTANLNAVYMHDDIMTFIVGDDGLILFVMEDQTTNTFEVTQHISPSDEHLQAVTSVLNGCPWAAGNNGTIIRASELWEPWEAQNCPYPGKLHDLDNIECTTAMAVGDNGTVLFTSDWGITWSYRNVPSSLNLFGISIGQFENIRAVGQSGNIWHTTDKGVTWTLEHQDPAYQLYDVVNVGLNNAYAVGSDETILETIDYGSTWNSPGTDFDLVSTPLYDVEYHFNQDVWVVGHYGVILKNSGIETEFEIQNEGWLEWLYTIDFINENEGWAVGGDYDYFSGISRGLILHTMDGGETWEQQQTLNTLLTDVVFINENEGWAVGRDGLIKQTSSGGASWVTQDCPLSGLLTSVSFVSEDEGWVVSRDFWGEIIHTSNGGNDWTEQVNPSEKPLHDVFFINDQKGWAVGLDTTIIRTTDGGQTWQGVAPYPVTGGLYTSVFFIDEMNGWIAGVSGMIVRSTDGGVTWQQAETGISEMLQSVFFIDADNGWAVGDRGTILRSVDGGAHWFKQRSGVSDNLLASVQFTDQLNGWVAGEGGTILHTENGGFLHEPGTFVENGLGLPILDNQETTSTITVDVSEVITTEYTLTGLEVFFDSILHDRVSDLEISLTHAGITQTLVYHVEDEGANFLWTTLADGSATPVTTGTAPFSGAYLPYQPLDVFNGADPNGEWKLAIFDSETGNTGMLEAWGLKPYFEKTLSIPAMPSDPPSVLLVQNYPNPFSISTSIKWRLEKPGHVILKVFDGQGKQVDCLVNTTMEAGDHVKEFDASALPAGIYYYQILAENHAVSKKMVLQK